MSEVKKTVKIKAWIWKGFSLKKLKEYELGTMLRFEKQTHRGDFIPCTITYTPKP